MAALASALLLAAPAHTQSRPQAPAASSDGIAELLDAMRVRVAAGDEAGLRSMLAGAAFPSDVSEFASGLMIAGDVVRAQVIELDRQPLDPAAPGEGHSLIVALFAETNDRAQIVAARFGVARPEGGDPNAWQIAEIEELVRVDRLFRLRVNQTRQFAARNFVVRSEDVELTLPSGTVFEVLSAEGATGLVLLGRGTMRFSPTPEPERGQLEIFSGAEVLNAEFESVFIRFSPREFDPSGAGNTLMPVEVNPRQLAAARAIFEEEAPKSFSVDLAELSDYAWYLLPPASDFVAEIHTRRYDTLTYSRTLGQSEDVALSNREDRTTIALYASQEKLAARGRFYTEDRIATLDIVDYLLDANIRYISGPRTPRYPFIEGNARLSMRVLADDLATFPLRLDRNLTVHGITSVEHGALLFLRVLNQNSVAVSLPTGLKRGAPLTLLVSYSGPLVDEGLDRYSVVQGDLSIRGRGRPSNQLYPFYPPEQNLLLSNRTAWYPQSVVSDYTTATLRLSVPEGYGLVASGVLQSETTTVRQDASGATSPQRTYVYHTPSPLRYFSAIISRFTTLGGTRVSVAPSEGQPGAAREIAVSVASNPRQQVEGRMLLTQAEDIVRFYTDLMGRYPYESLSLALVESGLPGGHSPAYATMLNRPVPETPFIWRADPAWFDDYPEFFLAHEIAHQWWGQAVGWKNYHEQWLSEGIAQYFAALYAEHAHGEEVFTDMLRKFHEWSEDESERGPVYLGYRLGHIEGRARTFRALVYNKSAAVLHMLRRLIGDEAFFDGLRRFYAEYEFQKAGTDDLRRVFEEVSGQPLERFFERWIYNQSLPRIRYRTAEGQGRITVRFEQQGDLVFDVPVTVTLTYANGTVQDVVVPVTDQVVEHEIVTSGAVRQVQVNRDYAALGEFDSE